MILRGLPAALLLCSLLPMLSSCAITPIFMPTETPIEKAMSLFRLASEENNQLRWDECLAGQALERAKQISGAEDFSYAKIGRVWDFILTCDTYRYGAENLAKGNEPAKSIHVAFKKSDKTRKNLSSSQFSLIGVACHKDICVELFAGY